MEIRLFHAFHARGLAGEILEKMYLIYPVIAIIIHKHIHLGYFVQNTVST